MNRKKLQLKALVNSSCTHTGINKQLVKEERIKMEPMNRSFEVFNTNRTKNGKVIQFAPLLDTVYTRRRKSIGLAQKYIEYVNSMK